MFPCYIIVTVAHRPASSLATKRPVSPCSRVILALLAPSRPYRAHDGMCSEAPCCLSPSLTALPAAVAAVPCHHRLLKMRSLGSGPRSRVTPPLSSLAGIWKPVPTGYFLRATSLRAVPSASRGLLFSMTDSTTTTTCCLMDFLGLVPLTHIAVILALDGTLFPMLFLLHCVTILSACVAYPGRLVHKMPYNMKNIIRDRMN
jgi:hypothetical protein